MSGVWGSWLRRLRRGETAGQDAGDPTAVPLEPDPEVGPEPAAWSGKPEAWPDAPEARSPDPSPGSHVPGTPGPVAPDLPAGLREDDVAPAVLPAPDPIALLRRGEPARALEAAISAGDHATAGLAEAIVAGEAVLAEQGLASALGAEALAGIMLAPAAGRRDLLVVFGADDGGFAVPRAAAGARRPHLLFVQDPAHSLAMLGVPRLGDSYDSCLLAILRLTRRLDAREVFCAGAGAACYSALRYGLDLGAAGVLAMGTLTRLERGPRVPGLRPGPQGRRLIRVAGELGADLDAAFARAAPRPGLVLCRPEASSTATPSGSAPSTATPSGSATLTATPSGLAALSGSTVLPAPAGAGDLLDWADRSGQLRGMVRELLKCRAVG